MKRKHLILPLSLLAFLSVSCDKENGASTKDTSGATPYTEQDWSWNKQQNGGFQIDTAWDGDTTINF